MLWLLAALLGLFISIAALLYWSPGTRDWTATRLLTDSIIKDKLAETPPRNEAQPVRIVNVPMRDGVKLSTQIYLPEGNGPWPVIVVRDPYSFSQYVFCKVWVRYGYACVNQEARGRGKSGGTWYPFVDERRDGIDTLDWILRQPWQNGKLALSGGSYLGVVQWAVAADLPPEVKTFVPIVAHGDVYELAYRGGNFRQPVEPGVLLKLEVEFVQQRATVCKFAGRATIEGKLAAEANFTAMIADPPSA